MLTHRKRRPATVGGVWFFKAIRLGLLRLSAIFWCIFSLAHAGPDSMPIRPAHGIHPMTNPPVFTWPSGKGPFQVEIESIAGERRIFRTERNWLTLDRALPIGEYRWRWQGQGSTPSGWIIFHMTANATDYPIPNPDVLWTRASSRPHPRSISIENIRRQAAPQEIANLRQALNRWRMEPLPVELPVPQQPVSPAELSQLHAKNRQLVFGEEDRILASAWLWLASGEVLALNEAKRRALHLAAWDVAGMSSFERHDQAGRSVAWALALTYDWLYDQLTFSERQALLQAIKPRLMGMLGQGTFGIDGSRRMDRNPFDSHGVTATARSSLICAVLAGVDAVYDRCFKDVVPRYLAWPVPWGWDSGGFANGTAYAHWQVLGNQLPVFILLSRVLGMDLLRHPWLHGYGNYIAYFLPPGTPSGLFGSETERAYPGVWATQAKAYAAALPSPLADWYARNQFGENRLQLDLLLSPWRAWNEIPGALPAGTPHAVHLPDIGWVAMHSDLGDRARTSVYFKSSPYGSYSHSHADQNSFVIHARGRVLAADSGYYDYYGSPHWKDWYKQTKAHNAITFDGGQGQMHDTMAAKGKITRFEHHADFDVATGDATEAYGGALSRAVRSIVYVRPNAVLVYDSLESKTPRIWEWNLHALSKMKEKGPRELEIEQDGVRLCVTLLDAPAGALSQTDRFDTEPHGKYARQWHARYATTSKGLRAQFLALLDVGCGGAMVAHSREAGRQVIAMAGRLYMFSEDGQLEWR